MTKTGTTCGLSVAIWLVLFAPLLNAADYSIVQVTEPEIDDWSYFQHVARPSISDDGGRVVFLSDTGHEGIHSLWLYERGRDIAHELTVNADGEEKILVSFPYVDAQISGDGEKIVFSGLHFYTEERNTGIYIFDIETGAIHLLRPDQIPRASTGAARDGAPGLIKRTNSMPSISSDGRWISYVLTDYEYDGATSDHWARTRQRLMYAEVSGGATVRGGTILEYRYVDHAFGEGIRSQRISGDGQTIAFYAGGVVRDLDVENLIMPPYESVRHSEHTGPTCDVYCYVVTVSRPGRYWLSVVPDSDSPRRPLVVAHPYAQTVQSFGMDNVLKNPPSLSSDGSRIALNAGFVLGAANTGVYVYERSTERTSRILSFGVRPGDGPGNQTLTTGEIPAMSADGSWLAYYRRQVEFPEGYGDPDSYVEGETYCPNVLRDDIMIIELPAGEISNLTETSDHPTCPGGTRFKGLSLSRDASHVAFMSTADIDGLNPYASHEIYLGSLLAAKTARMLQSAAPDFQYATSAKIFVDDKLADCRPLAVFTATEKVLVMDVGLPPFESSVDVYVVLWNEKDPTNVYYVAEKGTLQPFKDDYVAWRTAVNGSWEKPYLGSIQIANLEAGTYEIRLIVTSAKAQSIEGNYAWQTDVTLK
jgi:Tol biopolymer transport system component